MKWGFKNENRLCQWKFKIKTDYVNGKLMAVAGCRLIQSFNQPNKVHATSKLDFISKLSRNEQIKKNVNKRPSPTVKYSALCKYFGLIAMRQNHLAAVE